MRDNVLVDVCLICMCIYIYTYIYIQVYVCIYILIYLSIYIYVFMYLCVYLFFIYTPWLELVCVREVAAGRSLLLGSSM